MKGYFHRVEGHGLINLEHVSQISEVYDCTLGNNTQWEFRIEIIGRKYPIQIRKNTKKEAEEERNKIAVIADCMSTMFVKEVKESLKDYIVEESEERQGASNALENMEMSEN